MKQVVVILFLLMLELTTSAQSRILKGTITAAPNSSTTILPNIVVAKTTEGQKEDSAIYNPRYVPPPAVDSSKLTTNVSAQSSNGGVVESNYQYKTPDSKPYVDGVAKGLSPSVPYRKPQQVNDGAETYKYKTPDGKPIVEAGVYHYPKRIVTKPNSSNQKETVPANGIVTDPNALAASINYGGTTPRIASKWHPQKATPKKPVGIGNNSNNSIASVNNTPVSRNTSAQPTQSLTPPINRNGNAVNESVNYNSSTQESVTQRSDYKVEITTDGKFSVTFYNNGSNITVTSFGRIAGVNTPASGASITQQYDYRGLLQSIGGLPLQYTYEGRLQSVGSTNLSYNYNGNIQSIGNTPVYYNYNGTVDKIGNTRVIYDANGSVSGTSGANSMITIKQ